MANGPRSRDVIRFGVFDLDLSGRELRRQGRRVALQDKPFEVLSFLVERPGELITRDELQRRLWPGDTFVVFDDNLNTAVKKVRDALGDTPEGARFVETVPRRGYKFIAPIGGTDARTVDPPVTPAVVVPAAPAVPAAPEHVERPSLRTSWAAPVFLTMFGFAVGALLVFSLRAAPAPPPVVRELTFSGSDSEPAVSPDGRTVAFTSSRDGVSRIWLRGATGGEKPLTGGVDRRPRFFPDGNALLFIRSEGGVDSAWRVPLVAGAPSLVVADVVEADPSPRDGRVAFARLTHDGSPSVTLGTVDGQGHLEAVLATIPNAELSSIRWSPDGSQIAAVRRSSAGTTSAVIVVDVATKRVTEVPGDSKTGGAYGAVAWNGDGANLIVTRSQNPLVNMPGDIDRVLRCDPLTGRQVPVLFWPNLFGPFRSVGSNALIDIAGNGTILFHTVETRENLREILNSGGSTQTPLSTFGNFQDRQPAYAPDGQSIVFTSNRNGNYDLWRLWVATGQQEQLTDDPQVDRDPAVSKDGYLLWSSDRTGHLEVWGATLGKSGKLENQHQISHDGADAENPTMGEGDWVLYASRLDPQKLGIWRMRLDGTQASRLVAGDYSLPEVSPNGKYVLYRENDRRRRRAVIHVSEVDNGRVVPFQIVVPYEPQQATENITWGRARWQPGPDSKAIFFVGQAPSGRPSIFRQDFMPDQDTSPTRVRVVDSPSRWVTESFGISADGKRVMIADAFHSQSLMRAEGVAGIVAPRR